MTAIPLKTAYWCEDCQIIHDQPRQCPQCASKLAQVPLATWMTAKPKPLIATGVLVDKKGIEVAAGPLMRLPKFSWLRIQ